MRTMTLKEAAKALGHNTEKACRTALKRGCPFDLSINGRGQRVNPRLFDPAEIKLFIHRRVKRNRGWGKHDPRHGVIYCIKDPRTDDIRWFGKAGNYAQRVEQHLDNWEGRKAEGRRITNGLRAMRRAGHKPIFEIVEECPAGTMNDREKGWIAWGKANGLELWNIAEGGDGGPHSAETKSLLSKISKSVWNTPEYQKRHTAATGHRRISPEEKAKRDAEKERNRAINARNMEIAAQRKRERESLKTLTYLTHKGTAFVPLTQGWYAMIDEGYAVGVSKYLWHANRHHGRVRAWRNDGGSKTTLAAHVLCDKHADVIGFRDSNPLNCRRDNLVPGRGVTDDVMLDRIEQQMQHDKNRLQWHRNMALSREKRIRKSLYSMGLGSFRPGTA